MSLSSSQQQLIDQIYQFVKSTYIDASSSSSAATDISTNNSQVQEQQQQQQLVVDPNDLVICDEQQLRDSIRRFAIANQWDNDKTLKAIDKWVKWRMDKRPFAVQGNQVMREMRTQKAYWCGVDKEGHPVCVMKPQYHLPSQRDYDECLRFAYYTIEEGVKLMMKSESNSDGKCVIIYDGSNVGFSNLELSMFKDIIETIQMYPERMLRCFVIKPNWSFSALLTTVTPFLDPVTKSKIVTIKDYSELFQFVDPKQVQKEFGGQNTYDHVKYLESTEL